MDDKESKNPGDSGGSNDEQWREDAKSAGENEGRQAALRGELDAGKVADAGEKAGADAAWKGGGDSQEGGEIGKYSAVESWGEGLQTTEQRDSGYAREQQYQTDDD